ncbi:MAG: methionine--tRNA ligase [Candidatus Micrarchaeota archaeon]|nr:methionine--tRNA ligase [Candidatus Micrarchaeota archaeon]MCX8154753.1 methionine--tRNA ligase [Candidatus Micrarchaeota archaeon]
MYLITAALIYANGPIHLGHIKSTYLPADIFYRYLKLRGEEAIYVCATDDHGTPIVIEAERQNTTPKKLVEYYHYKDLNEFKQLGIEFDIFHWTSSQENRFTTLEFYQALKQYIYTKDVTQYYCEELGRFMPDRYIRGVCRFCGARDQYADQCESCGKIFQIGDLVDPYCTLTKTPPKLRSSTHLFFKLSYFRDFLDGYNKNMNNPQIYNYLRGWIEDLQDWDIVRDLDWGIPVPDLPGKVFYVWFDAPIGYIGSLRALRRDWREVWNRSKIYHFIGKDIIYHHHLFWPAMLHGAGYNLPYRIPVRGYLTLEGKKFSKSRKWFLSLEAALKHIHPDYIRYYMTSISPAGLVDSDFSIDELKTKINNELIGNYGNLITRTIKLWNGRELSRISIDNYESQMLEKYHEHMMNVDLKEGLETVMELVGYYNRILNDSEPWKRKYDDVKHIISRTVYGSMFATKLLQPFIPFTATKILDHYSVSRDLKYPEHITYNTPLVPFQKIDAEANSLRGEIGN